MAITATHTASGAATAPVGILAGGGSLPLELEASLQQQGRSVVIVAIEGASDLAATREDVVERNFGQIGGIIQAFKRARCREVLIVGSVDRPDMFSIRPDLGFFRALPTVVGLIRAGGDDAVLRGVIAYFARHGLKVIGPSEVAPSLLVKSGELPGTPPLSPADKDLAQKGFDVITTLAPFDVGQGLIISSNGIEAIEGAEGTDRMLSRVAAHRRGDKRPPARTTMGLLIKQPKLGQDLRVDLPVIGPRTVIGAVEAQLKGIIAEAGRVIVVSREDVQTRAINGDMTVAGLKPTRSVNQAPAARINVPSAASAFQVHHLGRVIPTDQDRLDAVRSAAVSMALEPHDCGHAVVTVRGHVLAVQAGEPARETIERSGSLKQWGEKRWRRRSGVALLSAARDATPELLDAVREAGLAGLAVRPQMFAARLSQSAVKLADERRLFIAELIGSNA